MKNLFIHTTKKLGEMSAKMASSKASAFYVYQPKEPASMKMFCERKNK